jgi:hypothetical protein
MIGKVYKALRKVSNLDYLFVVLRSAQGGYDRESALRGIQKIQADLEAEKAKALGKKKARPVSGGAVLNESEKMALQLGYVVRIANSLALTLEGQLLLQTAEGGKSGRLSTSAIVLLTNRLWQTYPIFGETILAICSQPESLMDLPTPGDPDFNRFILSQYDLDCDAITFKIIRETGTKLGLLNWHIHAVNQFRRQRVYAISCILKLDVIYRAKNQALDSGTYSDRCLANLVRALDKLEKAKIEREHAQESLPNLILEYENNLYELISASGEQFVVFPFQTPTPEQFEEHLWKTYLKLVNLRPLFPVIYPLLRNEVCFSIRISDEKFDSMIAELINEPKRIRVLPSAGILNYSRDLAHLHKHLPPQNETGQFMTFLKIDRVK